MRQRIIDSDDREVRKERGIRVKDASTFTLEEAP